MDKSVWEESDGGDISCLVRSLVLSLSLSLSLPPSLRPLSPTSHPPRFPPFRPSQPHALCFLDPFFRVRHPLSLGTHRFLPWPRLTPSLTPYCPSTPPLPQTAAAYLGELAVFEGTSCTRPNKIRRPAVATESGNVVISGGCCKGGGGVKARSDRRERETRTTQREKAIRSAFDRTKAVSQTSGSLDVARLRRIARKVEEKKPPSDRHSQTHGQTA